MKNKSLLLAVAISATLLAGCKNGVNGNLIASSGMSAYKAATLSDADVKALSNNACKQMDSENQLAGSKSKYTKRLSKIAKALGNNIDGTPVSYKVYMTSDINAWAMANGCVRVYSGLMDLMTDNEIEGVLGHVSLGHSRKAMQTAYATLAARDAISATSGVAAQLSQSQLGDLAEGVINSAFSRSQESDADDFSYDLLKKRGINTQGLVTAFDKFATMDAGHAKSLMDSHPASADRAQHMRDRIAEDKK
ncbi:M48 family metalloprotease [Salmonella enterica]|uniref:M48 family metalloprotease n=3 Tax=Salmonella enterica TaxID=28901 RepID=A0A761PIP1_SALER|nr:M48 family metalloprotease [Salmonella enterica]EAB5469818.1 metalloprotease [Salmonella enterica subsp. enterica serovar Typhisuis]EBM9899941.1 M48 family metalloprotease [Salmonella enterica subsp. enterica serovar Typhimurium]EBU9198605.1 metalloprotease [Salmonella enterica subsp. enterica serovar Stanley]EBV2121685.1 metalloprotease [Salmonella enterica subsp. enterica serovar Arechavaleta]ECD5485083.1 metalloprotease [Salmonella enterica subsp. enterica serovar Brijbhumi]ECZ0089013.1